MDVIVTLSAIGGLLGGTAAWVGIFSPRARAARTARTTRDRQQREVHEAIFGTSDRFDESGALMATGVTGLCADVRWMKEKLNAPLLNGKGDDLIATVDRLDRRSKRDGTRITAIERHLRADR